MLCQKFGLFLTGKFVYVKHIWHDSFIKLNSNYILNSILITFLALYCTFILLFPEDFFFKNKLLLVIVHYANPFILNCALLNNHYTFMHMNNAYFLFGLYITLRDFSSKY